MTLIKSISGIRGTIGGNTGDNLTPVDITQCTAAYAQIIREQGGNKFVIGRDGRITGEIVSRMVADTLMMMGMDVIDYGLSTTPAIEMAVQRENAAAGIILTASHNPREWNALKFLDKNGDFISLETGAEVLEYIEANKMEFSGVDDIGRITQKDDSCLYHVAKVLELDYVNVELIKSKHYHVVVDCINSTGAISIPPLLDALGCSYTLLNEAITGDFAHNPEPLQEHLTDLAEMVKNENAALGISVDPDVDRLALVMEDGDMFGEEYTLVAAADLILSKNPGSTVSNLSSTRALRDLTSKYDQDYFAAKVGEVNVVNKMKEVGAVIGGEGNGGVILPELHYGRDAIAGIALILTLMAERDASLSNLRSGYPDYHISKNKVQLTDGIEPDEVIKVIATNFQNHNINTEDGLKIDFPDSWVQLRKSNTEPIVRVYAEAKSPEAAKALAERVLFMIEGISDKD